jgi:DNA invertase Pin-like site-specific DNA recombinase
MQRNSKETVAAVIRQVALYARVSKDICQVCGKSERLHPRADLDANGETGRLDHAFKGQDPEAQLQPLRQMCASRGWVVTKEYVDKGWSGATESRPELDQLMADAKRGRQDFDAVVVWKFDRFARSTKHLLAALESFQSDGIAFISLTESVDTSTLYGKLVFTILGAVAEFERSLIAERICAGMRKRGAKRPGPKIGEQGPSRTTLWRRSQHSASISTQSGN